MIAGPSRSSSLRDPAGSSAALAELAHHPLHGHLFPARGRPLRGPPSRSPAEGSAQRVEIQGGDEFAPQGTVRLDQVAVQHVAERDVAERAPVAAQRLVDRVEREPRRGGFRSDGVVFHDANVREPGSPIFGRSLGGA